MSFWYVVLLLLSSRLQMLNTLKTWHLWRTSRSRFTGPCWSTQCVPIPSSWTSPISCCCACRTCVPSVHSQRNIYPLRMFVVKCLITICLMSCYMQSTIPCERCNAIYIHIYIYIYMLRVKDSDVYIWNEFKSEWVILFIWLWSSDPNVFYWTWAGDVCMYVCMYVLYVCTVCMKCMDVITRGSVRKWK